MSTGNKITWSVAGVVGFLTALAQVPQVHDYLQGLLSGHANAATIVGGIAVIIALFHNPTPAPASAAK